MDQQFSEYLVQEHAVQRLREANAERLAGVARQAKPASVATRSFRTPLHAIANRFSRSGTAPSVASSRS